MAETETKTQTPDAPERPVETPSQKPSSNGARASDGRQDADERKGEEDGWSVRQVALLALLGVALIVGAWYGWNWWQYSKAHATTENATISGHISPVLPRVDGYVAAVRVDDNEQVAEGQVLATIDSSDFAVRVRQAKAALQSARTQLQNGRAQLASARAQSQQAAAAEENAQTKLARQQQLEAGVATTQQAVDNATFGVRNAEAQHEAARQQIEVARAKVAQAQAQIEERRAALEDARLKLSYTTLEAPVGGRVAQKDIEEGQYVRPGQPLMSVVKDQDVWVTANFKEGKIAQIEVGQPVEIEVDAYPDRTFEGRVQSIAGGTGSEFALLPSDNASGNFVKVEKRIPVKIVFTDPQDPAAPLRPGMNVVPSVQVKPEGGD